MGKMVGMAEFKANCLTLIDELALSGETLTIMREGRSPLVLKASDDDSSAPKRKRESLLGVLKGTTVIHGDLDEPLDPDWEEKWLADWDEQMRDDAR